VKVFTSARAPRPTREEHPAVTTTRQPAYDAAVVMVGALETVAEAP
jgi:hypothetical protein